MFKNGKSSRRREPGAGASCVANRRPDDHTELLARQWLEVHANILGRARSLAVRARAHGRPLAHPTVALGASEHQRPVRVEAGLGADVLQALAPLGTEEVEAQAVGLGVDLLQ